MNCAHCIVQAQKRDCGTYTKEAILYRLDHEEELENTS